MGTEPVPESTAQLEVPIKRKVDRAAQRRLKRGFPFLLLLVFLVYAYTTNYIPSESMEPTLKPGDHIATMRAWLAYPGGRMPARGDIIVFQTPPVPGEKDADANPEGRKKLLLFRDEAKDVLIKRVAGLPGETVQVYGNQLYINGKIYPWPYPIKRDSGGNGWYAVWHPAKLGPDELLVLGDNRANSEDSRFWGPLKRKYVVGRFACVLWNEGNDGPNAKRAKEDAKREGSQ